MTLIISLILLLILLIAVPFGIIYARQSEKKDWNKGYCPKCGAKWRYFDIDSQGGRGYCCDKCRKYIWISYNVDRYETSKSEKLG